MHERRLSCWKSRLDDCPLIRYTGLSRADFCADASSLIYSLCDDFQDRVTAERLLSWLLRSGGCSGTILAQAQQGPPTVRSIDVEYTGPATVSKERIIAQLRTAVGKPYSDAVVEQDIRQLYSTGAIRNVRIFCPAGRRRR